MSNPKVLAVIPARYGSTRLPGKPLIEIGGLPLILHVLRGVRSCSAVSRVLVATDDERIVRVVEQDNGEALVTPPELASGGDRVAWVASRYDADLVLNVQGDDPLVDAAMIDPLIAAMKADPSAGLALLVKEIEDRNEVDNPNIVKAVFDCQDHGLYFSRSPVPYPRHEATARWFKHIGPYCWRRDFLLNFTSWPQTPLEKVESLEMLRVLEQGHRLLCVETKQDTIEIDTPQDVAKLEQFLQFRSK